MDTCETCEVEGPRVHEISPILASGIALHRAFHQLGAAFMLALLPALRPIVVRLGGEVDEPRVAMWGRITDKNDGYQ